MPADEIPETRFQASGPLPRWKQIAGKGAEVQDTFLAVKQAIDTYFSGQSFNVSIEAGLFIGQKP